MFLFTLGDFDWRMITSGDQKVKRYSYRNKDIRAIIAPSCPRSPMLDSGLGEVDLRASTFQEYIHYDCFLDR
jgi:hypothetical protein